MRIEDRRLAEIVGELATRPGHDKVKASVQELLVDGLGAGSVVTRFERGRSIRTWQPKRDGECNEALDTFVYASTALHGLISMGLRLHEEADAVVAAGRKGKAPVAKPASAWVIRSAWMG